MAAPIRDLVQRFDGLLRRCLGVYEFTTDPACILRISLQPARTCHVLADGTHIEPGDALVTIHLWNERLPRMPSSGADLRWAVQIYRSFVASLRILARHVALDPKLTAAVAIFGETGFLTTAQLDSGVGALTRLGFEIHRLPPPANVRERFIRFWPNLYSHALLWTFNPATLPDKPFWRLERCQVWMSRAALEQRYGQSPPK